MSAQQQPGGIGQLAAHQHAGGGPPHNVKWHMKFATNLKTKMSGADSNQAEIYEARIGDAPFVIRKVVLMQPNAPAAEARRHIWGKEEDMRRFVKELEFWRRASVHPHIVELHSWTVGWKSGQLCAWMAMPRVNGRTLRQSCTIWNIQLDPVPPMGGLTDDADKAFLEKWILQVFLAVDFLHREGIAHDSLHTRNILLEAGGKRNAIVIDFGRCIDLRSPKLSVAQAIRAQHADLLSIVHLYVFGRCGYFRPRGQDRTQLPEVVWDRCFPKAPRPAAVDAKASPDVKKAHKEALEAWQKAQRERWFVKGVLTATPDTLTANQILCLPFFEGAEKDQRGGAKSSWALKTPKEDQFHPTGPSLNTLFKGDGGKLKVRSSMATEVFGVELEGEAGRPDFVVYPSLAPKSYACMTPTPHCPAGALYSEAQFSSHGHDANGKPCEAPYREPLLRSDVTQRQKDLFKLTRGAEAGGGVNYMFLKKPQACSKGHPMNMKIYLNDHLDRHEFRLQCAAPGCNEFESGKLFNFCHLAEIVEPSARRADRIEPFSELFSSSLVRKDPDATALGVLLAESGVTWVPPTIEEFKARGQK